MKITVNEKTYNDATWNFNMERGEASLRLLTDETISEVAATFDGDDVVRAYDDNDVETGVWYVHSVISIYQNWESRTEDQPREVIVSMKASALSAEAEEALSSDIGENMEAILELAELIAVMDDANIEIGKIKAELEGIPKDLVARFDAINSVYNALADRVARLENKNQ